jgi:hypothetical protein
MGHYNNNNTEGYTQDQLDKLNNLFDEQVTDDMSADEIQNLSEKILVDFDTENSNIIS